MNFGHLDALGWAIALGVGLFTGIVSGLMGIGGGNILVPASTVLLGVTQHQAQGVSLVVIVPTAIVGTYSHWRRGNVDLRAALLIALGAILAALAGARLAQFIPGGTLKTIFGLILVYFAQRYLGLEDWLRARLRSENPGHAARPSSVPAPDADLAAKG